VRVAIVHDSIAQLGGAERVLLNVIKAFPDAPIYTAIFDPDATYPEFRHANIKPLGINRFGLFRRNHRLALPFLARAYSKLQIDADVVFCFSWGWAHGEKATGRKVVYCYTPARWLYQSDRYVGSGMSVRKAVLLLLRRPLTRWDRRKAATADRYVTLSQAVQARIASLYGLESEVLAPPPGLRCDGPSAPVAGIEPGFLLCASRFLPYKNVIPVVESFALLPEHRLVVVGTGPTEGIIRQAAGANVTVRRGVSDAELRWLYQNCGGVVTASYEDFGLTPLEGANFGKPAAVLRWGGFTDTVEDGRTGVFFDRPEGPLIAAAIRRMSELEFDPQDIKSHASGFTSDVFIGRMQRIAEEEFARLGERAPSR
jgi:glycosyltransferase involved in cell wall biosynthesis